MQRYWLRIALGALAVFALGMAAISIYRSGVEKVSALASSAEPITIPLGIMPFQVDGDRLGRIQEVQIRRDAPKQVSGIGLVVQLSDSATAEPLAACLMTVRDGSHQGAPSFHCGTPADSLADSLTAFGELRFEPGGVVRTFFVPARVLDDWRAGRNELVSVDAEPHVAESRSRAVIKIDNDSGDTVFELHADSTGARIRIRDEAGREVFKVDADSTGARLMVRDDSVRRKSRH
jgi:hypothetical protein